MDSLQASRITGGNSATGRRQSDFYPTPPEVTVALMRFLKLPAGTNIWEPARGQGDMVRALADCGMAVYGTDIRDGIDFLTTRQPGNAPAADWIITNPPFSLADEFIRHAAEIGKPFAMLLKAQYWHAAKRAQLFREIPPSYVLPLTWRPDFLFKERNGKKGASPLMDVMWCVWLTPQMQGVQTAFKPLMRPEMSEKEFDEFPAADVAPVVRCKDCKHRFKDSWCEYVDDDDNFYCARGERKGGAD